MRFILYLWLGIVVFIAAAIGYNYGWPYGIVLWFFSWLSASFGFCAPIEEYETALSRLEAELEEIRAILDSESPNSTL